MSTATNLLYFPDRKREVKSANSNSTRVNPIGRSADGSSYEAVVPDQLGYKEGIPGINIDDLYPIREAVRPELDIALGLLDRCIADTDYATGAIEQGNDIEADDAMQRTQALLPELFNCRALGDGYGLIVNSLLGSFENRRGKPLLKQQIIVVRQALHRLRSEPFIHFDIALNDILRLEEAGLITEPPGFEALADCLDG